MNRILQLVFFAGLLTMTSCFKQQNTAPSEGANLDDPRIYGNKGGEPLQLPNKYEASADVDERALAIKAKLFPMPEQTDNSTMDVASDTTNAATEEVTATEGGTTSEE